MNIFVDADSCPAAIRPIIEKAAERREIPTVFVANRPIPVKKLPNGLFPAIWLSRAIFRWRHAFWKKRRRLSMTAESALRPKTSEAG